MESPNNGGQPPSQPPYGSPYGSPQHPGLSPYSAPVVQYMQVPLPQAPPNAGGAVASMVLGIVSMFLCCFGWITGIIAVALAAKAMKQISDSGGQYSGRGMAITGLVLGIIALVCYLPWMILWLVGAAGVPLTQ